MGVDTGGAGDQGLMFGFACDETEELMPMPIQLAHRLTQRLAEVRKNKKVNFLRPDGKSQVTIEYRDGRPARIDTVVISTQHDDKVSNEELRDAITNQVIKPILPAAMLDSKTKYHINPTGTLRHRRTHGRCRRDRTQNHRGFLWWIQPPWWRRFLREGSQQGRSFRLLHGALHRQEYRVRRLGRKAEVQLAYAIGVAEPVSVMAETFGTANVSEEKMT